MRVRTVGIGSEVAAGARAPRLARDPAGSGYAPRRTASVRLIRFVVSRAIALSAMGQLFALIPSCSSGSSGKIADGGDGGSTGSTKTGIVCTGTASSSTSCQCVAADHTDTTMGCFVLGGYPCCASGELGQPDFECSCTPDLPMVPPVVTCQTCPTFLDIGCQCATGGYSNVCAGGHGVADVTTCTGQAGGSCYVTQTADLWTCTCPAGGGSTAGTPVPNCDPPASLTVRMCPAGTNATNNCDGNCHDEQCNGCAGQTCDSAGCEGDEQYCENNKCVRTPAGATCGFSP